MSSELIEFIKDAAVFVAAMGLGAVIVIVVAAYITARDEDDVANGEDE